MRQLDWQLLRVENPYSFGMFYAWLETPNLTKSNILYYGRNGLPFNYRDLCDFFDMFNIEWAVDSGNDGMYVANVADYDDEHFAHGEFNSRVEAEIFCINVAFTYLNERSKHKFN